MISLSLDLSGKGLTGGVWSDWWAGVLRLPYGPGGAQECYGVMTDIVVVREGEAASPTRDQLM
jgi:hypothetical protein